MAKPRVSENNLFQRHEKKYMLTGSQADTLKDILLGRMEVDAYGRHTIQTLYLDTEDYAIIRNCLEKPTFRTKVRLRSYGVPAREDTVFLELKKKFDGITYKRREPLTLRDAECYLAHRSIPDGAGPNFGEIDHFFQCHRPKPRVVVSYDRVALFDTEGTDLRITFDHDIRFRDYDLDLGHGDYGKWLLEPGHCLMEIKTLFSLPLWLANTLSEAQAFPTTFSKYGTIYQNYLIDREVLRHVG